MPKKERDLILDRIEEMHKDLKDLREKDLPKLQIEMAVMKEKTSHHAKVITGIGGAITLAVSTAVAWITK
jgi:hypothetical protein